MDVGVLNTRRSYDLHLFGKSLLELVFQEGGHLPKLQIHHVLLQALGIPQGKADTLTVDLGFKEVGDKVTRRLPGDDFVLVDVAFGSLPFGERECGFEELQKRSLAGGACADDEDTGGTG